jgi:peptidoglycan/LPS O-acetylase OafA/YrhL
MKLSEKASARDNNFDAIRLGAATMVMVSHTFKLSGSDFDPFAWVSHYNTTGGLGVSIFFIISGFLITKSWHESPRLLEYFKKRALRILPALAASSLLCVLVIGPLVTNLGTKDYFLHPWTRQYLKNVFLYMMRYNLPGVFANNPVPDAVNGSLWTLTVEFYCYCFVAVLGVLGILVRRKFLFLLAPVALAMDFFLRANPEYFNKVMCYMIAGWASWCIVFFMMGSVLYMYREYIPLKGRIAFALLLVYMISWPLKLGHYVSFFTLPYLVLYIAYLRLPFIDNLGGKVGDFSYGVYVYAFPVQQAVIYFMGDGIGRFTYFAASFFITLALSAISWHLVEKPALDLKKVRLFSMLFFQRKAG